MSTKTDKSIIGLKELRENVEVFIKRVQAGESLTVVRRSRPVFRLTPIDTVEDDTWETVVDCTDAQHPNDVSATTLLNRLKQTHG